MPSSQRAAEHDSLAQKSAPPATSSPTPWQLLRVWLGLSAQSFGGGAATQYLIYRAFVDQRSWISAAEFTRFWAICQIAPGINLLALTILIGWRLGRSLGVLVSLVGLLAPSVLITVLMTAAYAGVRDTPTMRAALRGVVPATAGLGILMSWQLAVPLLREARLRSIGALVLSISVLLGSLAAVGLLNAPVILVLLVAGLVSGLVPQARERRLT